SIFISAVTIGEIQTGIEITREQDLSKANELESWLNQIIAMGQIISLDAECFKLWAKLKHRQSNTIYEDAMIAATAILLKLTVVTRNTKDFKRFKVQLLNDPPYQGLNAHPSHPVRVRGKSNGEMVTCQPRKSNCL
ncbi:MAG: type II toxin-antitoxin system VapC family toxin, partial [Burkholderiaceae bacterium]|nr:type II toxin-antitoxin system VapC family toxin [Burkholderiaceae bacterium]